MQHVFSMVPTIRVITA